MSKTVKLMMAGALAPPIATFVMWGWYLTFAMLLIVTAILILVEFAVRHTTIKPFSPVVSWMIQLVTAVMAIVPAIYLISRAPSHWGQITLVVTLFASFLACIHLYVKEIAQREMKRREDEAAA